MTDTTAGWIEICGIQDIPVLGSRIVARERGGNIAIFRNAAERVFALLDRCPHKGGPLSQGIVFGERVACPLHNWSIGLVDGAAAPPDEGCTSVFTVRIADGRVFLDADEVRSRGTTAAPDLPDDALAA